MYIILCYDVGSERIGRVRKITKKYLHPVQKSVFDGYLTEGELNKLKKELLPCLDSEVDQVQAYVIRSTANMRIDQIGISAQKPTQFL